MEDIYLYIGAMLLLIAQIGCFFLKKVWLRLIPVWTAVSLTVFCTVMYACSGFTNWGYLILIFLLFCLLAAIGFLWLMLGVICGIMKRKIKAVKKKYLTDGERCATIPQVSSEKA